MGLLGHIKRDDKRTSKMKLEANVPITTLKITETIEDIYVYMDNNKQSIDIFYNDEKRLRVNLVNILKKLGKNIKPSKLYQELNDLKIRYYPDEDPYNLVFTFDLKDSK